MPDKIITDFFGNPIGRISEDSNGKKTVTSWTGEVLGTSDEHGTRDFFGNPVSNDDVPDILLPRQDD